MLRCFSACCALWLIGILGCDAHRPSAGGGEAGLHTPIGGSSFAAQEALLAESKILYIVRTSEKTRERRLASILQTWAAQLPQESLLIVGYTASESPKVYSASGCNDDHARGLNCKTGHALALAASMIGYHSWAFVIDDDVYVNTTNLDWVLQQHDPGKLQALGIHGCRRGSCADGKGGFCGGGGYAISRAALQALVDKPNPIDFREEFLETMAQVFNKPGEEPADDIVAACLMKQHGVEVKQLDGLHGWRLDSADPRITRPSPPHPRLDPQYLSAIHSVHPLPLTFHYITVEEMHLIHDEFTRMPEASASSLIGFGRFASYEEQLQQFLEHH